MPSNTNIVGEDVIRGGAVGEAENFRVGGDSFLKSSIERVKNVKSKALLATQDIFLTSFAYLSFFLFSYELINIYIFSLIIFLYSFRIFNIRHEKVHTPLNSGYSSRWLDLMSDYFSIYYVPYHEPYSGKRWKHLAHHKYHMSSALKAKSNLKNDPHSIFEKGSVFQALALAFFYEEVNFYLDIKFKRPMRSRLVMFLVSLIVIPAMIFFAGWMNFLILTLIYRVSLMSAWFTFSYLMHLDFFYEKNIGELIPRPIRRASNLLLGDGLSTAVFFHKSHHRLPNHYVK